MLFKLVENIYYTKQLYMNFFSDQVFKPPNSMTNYRILISRIYRLIMYNTSFYQLESTFYT